jgi:hypothetical protein
MESGYPKMLRGPDIRQELVCLIVVSNHEEKKARAMHFTQEVSSPGLQRPAACFSDFDYLRARGIL